MYHIQPHALWVGHGGEGHDFPAIFEAGIEAVVELASEEPVFPSRRDLISCRFPLSDGTGNRPEVLALAVRTVAALIAAGIPTLVCCGAGMSRAPAVVALALAWTRREPPETCLKNVAAQHPGDVSPALWADLIALPAETPVTKPR